MVYPRVCGGTPGPPITKPSTRGLSPRVRGNHLGLEVVFACDRSIPACAGEPVAGPAAPATCEVYPRVCGGTQGGQREDVRAPGLSPRVRGNRHRVRPPSKASWSIPACAGEPTMQVLRSLVCRVYPRVCGGTTGPIFSARKVAGLSPRVRGNLSAYPSDSP